MILCLEMVATNAQCQTRMTDKDYSYTALTSTALDEKQTLEMYAHCQDAKQRW